MNYKSTLKWYADNDPLDFPNIIKLIEGEQTRLGSGAGEKLVSEPTPVEGLPLEGKNVCLVIGHEPGGGAEGEREWNIKVANILAKNLEAKGSNVFIYTHRTRSYTQRCREMRAGILKHMPDADCVILLHYNGVDYPAAHGHEFHYRGVKALASCLRDAWQKRYLWSKARQDQGILKNTNGRGSKMLQLAPAAACLTEPFFQSNPEERGKLINDHEGVASCYADGIAAFLLS